MSKQLNLARAALAPNSDDGPNVIGAVVAMLCYLETREAELWTNIHVSPIPKSNKIPWTYQAVGMFRERTFYGNGRSEEEAITHMKDEVD